MSSTGRRGFLILVEGLARAGKEDLVDDEFIVAIFMNYNYNASNINGDFELTALRKFKDNY